ncbi:MAG TPA: FecR domain-containing protein [Saprospiraceae bacterium]|nr:FecR domain-containing protein [Saprospiraceae bacterium]HMQ85117.1 FecR domain-containing protein [Saprospiraceae bacterium]
MEKNQLASLIHKKLTGSMHEEDRKKLEDLSRHREEHALAQKFEKTWEKSATYKSNYQPDIDRGWERFKNKMQSESSPTQGTSKVKVRKLSWGWAAAAALALLLGLAWWQMGGNSVNPVAANSYSTGSGEQTSITLEDGTEVVLNQNSELTLTSDLSQDGERVVNLQGEAFFKVQPDTRPFIIYGANVKVEVLGTAFNLRTYEEEAFSAVSVTEGLVQLTDLQKNAGIKLEKGMQGTIYTDGKMTRHKNDANVHAWRTQKLFFRNTSLAEVEKALEKYYNISIEMPDVLLSCNYSGSFDNKPLQTVITTLEASLPIRFYKEQGTYRIEGTGCK